MPGMKVGNNGNGKLIGAPGPQAPLVGSKKMLAIASADCARLTDDAGRHDCGKLAALEEDDLLGHFLRATGWGAARIIETPG